VPQERELSPTTSIWHVLLTAAIGFSLALLFSGRGLVHSAQGMTDGPMKRLTLSVGQMVAGAADRFGGNAPWDRAQAALGRKTQPALPPMLSSNVFGEGRHPSLNVASGFQIARWTLQHKRPPRPAAIAHPPALRRPNRHYPFRLLITGDSLSGYLGPLLLDETSHAGPIVGWTDTHDGTGLVSPNFVDWSVVAQQQVAAHHPDAVVVMIGGNDFQNMVTASGRVLIAGTPAWTAEYQRRAAICMRIWTQNSATHRVYWLSMPPVQRAAWAAVDRQINVALPRAARSVPGAEYLDILGPITNHGRYADFVPVNGQMTLIREPDGVHLNITGSDIVAHEVLTVIRREWHLRWR
jgi:hypothetical protein